MAPSPMVRLTALSPDNAGWKLDLDWFEGEIARLSQLGAPFRPACGQASPTPSNTSLDPGARRRLNGREGLKPFAASNSGQCE